MRHQLAIIAVSVAALTASAWAQAPAAERPDAPSSSRPVVWMNYSAAQPRSQHIQQSTRQALPDAPSYTPLSDHEKFQIFLQNAESPLTFLSAGFSTGVDSARGYHPYGAGALGSAKSYGAALATKESNAFFSNYLFPRLLNQDPRYHPSSSEKMMSRAFYAASRVLITRNDKGKNTANTSYLLSTVTSSTLANAYKPAYYRSVGNTASDIATSIGGDAGMNVLREFWPQLREGLGKIEPKPVRVIREKVTKKVSGDEE